MTKLMSVSRYIIKNVPQIPLKLLNNIAYTHQYPQCLVRSPRQTRLLNPNIPPKSSEKLLEKNHYALSLCTYLFLPSHKTMSCIHT